MNEKSIQLAKNTAVIAVSKIFTSLFGFLLLPLYTRYLSTSEYGSLDLIITYGTLCAPIIILRMEIAIFRWLVESRNDKEKTKLIIYSILEFVALILLLFAIVFIILSLIINIPYAYYILLYVISLAISSVTLQIVRGLGKTVDYAVSSVISGLLSLILCVVFVVVLEMGVKGVLFGMSIGFLSGSIYAVIKSEIYKINIFRGREKRLIRKNMLTFSTPMIPNSISWWVVNVSDRTIISTVIGLAANGIYAVSNKFSGLALSIYSIFDLSWSESASLHIDAPDRDDFFSKVLNTVVKFFGSMGIVLLSSIPLIFNVVVGKAYGESYKYIPVLMVGIFANIMVKAIGNIYVAQKKTRKIMNTTIIAAIINIAINLALIWSIGIWAAVISTVVAYGAMVIYRSHDIKKTIKIKYDVSVCVKLVGAFSLISLFYYLNIFWLNIVSLFIAILFAILLNRKMISSSLGYIYRFMKSRSHQAA